MLNRLRRRLTALFTVLTSLVLGVALIVTWSLAGSQYRAGVETLFISSFRSLSDTLENGVSVSDSWLGKQEAASRCLIYIEDNGAPLHFDGVWQPQTGRDTMRRRAGAAAASAGLTTPNAEAAAVKKQTVEFTLAGDQGETYQGAAATLPRGQNGAVQLFYIQDVSAVTRHLWVMAAQYLALWLGGVLLLALISWFLAGKALQPTAESMQRQNEFIAAASHELRSPLAVIRASLDAVESAQALPAQQTRFLHTAQSEAGRMTRLTDDLLLLAGSDANALTVRMAPVPLDTFCIEVYEQFYLLAKQRGHLLTLKLPEAALPTVRADAERLKQLLAILINNALAYAPPDTPFELVAERGKAGVSLSVVDHGKGLTEEEKAHVFDRFYRADKSRSDKAHFGLGLAVAREIAALHGARLTVSDTPGGGASFRLSLPAGLFEKS